jgi:hypothetical protein
MINASDYLKAAGVDYEGQGGRHRIRTDRSAPANHADPDGVEIGRLQMVVRRMALGRNAPV